MPPCPHTLQFYDPLDGIMKDDEGYYRIWYCAYCGAAFKDRDLDTK